MVQRHFSPRSIPEILADLNDSSLVGHLKTEGVLRELGLTCITSFRPFTQAEVVQVLSLLITWADMSPQAVPAVETTSIEFNYEVAKKAQETLWKLVMSNFMKGVYFSTEQIVELAGNLFGLLVKFENIPNKDQVRRSATEFVTTAYLANFITGSSIDADLLHIVKLVGEYVKVAGKDKVHGVLITALVFLGKSDVLCKAEDLDAIPILARSARGELDNYPRCYKSVEEVLARVDPQQQQYIDARNCLTLWLKSPNHQNKLNIIFHPSDL